MYIKSLFLMICGLQLHAATHNSNSLPTDLDATASGMEITSRTLAQLSLGPQPSDDPEHTIFTPDALELCEQLKSFQVELARLIDAEHQERKKIDALMKKKPTITNQDDLLLMNVEIMQKQARYIALKNASLATLDRVGLTTKKMAEIFKRHQHSFKKIKRCDSRPRYSSHRPSLRRNASLS